MTDVNLASPPVATPLATLFASEKPQAAYRGVISPVELDARQQEIAALAGGAAMHDLGWLRRIEVRGEDRVRWLSGMVTNMVKDLATNAGAWNLVLNAQGRIQGDLTVWRSGDELEIEVAADQYDRLIAHLDHFIIMDDVELASLDSAGLTAVGLTGPQASEILGRMGLPVLAETMTQKRVVWNGLDVLLRRGYGVLAEHYALWVAADRVNDLWQALSSAGAHPAGFAACEAFRIAEGIPAYGIDIAERDLPQETSQMRALHFNKGCYLGQEIVERIRSRGSVHRHLRALELDGPIPAQGAELSTDGKAAGQITSAAELPLAGGTRVFALGMLRAEAELHNEPLAYKAGETTSYAHILAAPPSF